ncbi:MAG: tyrosine-type recombinase/integrase [Peptostreptococcaceae bacterium]|nr:tyrosine-type recombinase/integrase [Peptostreptococcaceae bacterium]
MKNIDIEKEIDLYKETLENQGKSENTIKNNVSQIKKFLNSGMELEEYKEYLLKKEVINARGEASTMKPKSVNTIINIIKSYYKVKGIQDDTKLVKVQQQNFLTDILSENEFQRILKQVRKNNDVRAEALFIFLARTGCRISEALSVTKEQIKKLKKKGGIITVFGKGNKSREIIIPKEVMPILIKYMNDDIYKDKSDKVFTSKYGSYTRQTAHNDIKKYTGLARIKKEKGHLHNLRHLFCINAINSGLDITEVAQMVGHGDINTTKIYTSKSADDLKAILDKIKY